MLKLVDGGCQRNLPRLVLIYALNQTCFCSDPNFYLYCTICFSALYHMFLCTVPYLSLHYNILVFAVNPSDLNLQPSAHRSNGGANERRGEDWSIAHEQCTARLLFTPLHCTPLHCTALLFTAFHCTPLQCTMHCTSLH